MVNNEDPASGTYKAHHELSFTVNGTTRVATVEARKTLADVLREDLGLTGTNLGCEHGICGACTVLINGQPIRSCLVFGVQCSGATIETVESLETSEGLHPLQQAFSDRHGLQCGFCTPGFLMLAAGLLRNEACPNAERIREVIASNLCRCTGYQGILEAVADVAESSNSATTVEPS